MQQLIYVFIGGGIGSSLRYLIGLSLNKDTIPYGTLTVNVLGSLLIGILMGYYMRSGNSQLSNNQIAFIAVGIFGGFTTFSSFMYENLQFLINQQYFRFVGYSLLSIALGFLMVFMGFLIGERI